MTKMASIAKSFAYLMDLKNVRRGRIEEYAKRYKCEFFPMKRPWV